MYYIVEKNQDSKKKTAHKFTRKSRGPRSGVCIVFDVNFIEGIDYWA